MGVKAGDKFAVDRRTGTVTGERVPAFNARRFDVLGDGKNGNSFKVVFSGQNGYLGYLAIAEYKAGKSKPFILDDSIWVATGICE